MLISNCKFAPFSSSNNATSRPFLPSLLIDHTPFFVILETIAHPSLVFISFLQPDLALHVKSDLAILSFAHHQVSPLLPSTSMSIALCFLTIHLGLISCFSPTRHTHLAIATEPRSLTFSERPRPSRHCVPTMTTSIATKPGIISMKTALRGGTSANGYGVKKLCLQELIPDFKCDE